MKYKILGSEGDDAPKGTPKGKYERSTYWWLSADNAPARKVLKTSGGEPGKNDESGSGRLSFANEQFLRSCPKLALQMTCAKRKIWNADAYRKSLAASETMQEAYKALEDIIIDDVKRGFYKPSDEIPSACEITNMVAAASNGQLCFRPASVARRLNMVQHRISHDRSFKSVPIPFSCTDTFLEKDGRTVRKQALWAWREYGTAGDGMMFWIPCPRKGERLQVATT